MKTGNPSRTDSPFDTTGGLTQDTLRRLRLDRFDNNNCINVADTAINTDTIRAAVAAAAQDGPEAKRDSDDAAVVAATRADLEAKPEHNDDEMAGNAEDQLVVVHSDQAPQAPIHAASTVVADRLEGTAMLVQAAGTPCSAVTEGAEMPAPVEERGGEKVPVGQEKYVDRNPAAMAHNDLRTEREGEGRNNLDGGGGEQDPRLKDGIPSFDEDSVAVADGSNSEVSPKSDMNMDSIDGLDLETDKHGDTDGSRDRELDGDRVRVVNGDRVAAGQKGIEKGLSGTDDETVSANQSSQGNDQARAPHASNMIADDDAKMKETYYDHRIREIDNNAELVLGKGEGRGKGGRGNTGKGGALRTCPASGMYVVSASGGNTPQRSDRHWLQKHSLIQELFRFIALVICCTLAIVILSRNGTISLSPDESRLLTVDGLDALFVPVSEKGGKNLQQGDLSRPNKKPANIGDFGDVEMRAFTLSDDGKVWACLPEHGSTKEPCKVVAQVVSLSAVVHDQKGDSIPIKAAFKPSRKWWNVFARKKKEGLRVEVAGSVTYNKNNPE